MRRGRSWHGGKGLLEHLSEIVLLRDLHLHGLNLPGVFRQLWNTLPRAAFLWLLAGGLVYTAGGVIYALKLPIFNTKHKYFGSHKIFHLFVMGGSICHFIFMFCYMA